MAGILSQSKMSKSRRLGLWTLGAGSAHFIDRFAEKGLGKFKTIDMKSLKAFQSYVWPSNVRAAAKLGLPSRTLDSKIRRLKITSTASKRHANRTCQIGYSSLVV
jgi:hypothetical protein